MCAYSHVCIHFSSGWTQQDSTHNLGIASTMLYQLSYRDLITFHDSEVRWQQVWIGNSAPPCYLCDKNRDSYALQRTDLSCVENRLMIALKASAWLPVQCCTVPPQSQRDCSLQLQLATAHSPCVPSETCASFQANYTIWYAIGLGNSCVHVIIVAEKGFLVIFLFLIKADNN